MKTIIILLATTMLAVGATSAMAAPQGSEEAAGYALSLQAARGGQNFNAQNFNAYASAREPGQVRNSTVPTAHDFQLDGR